MWLSKGASTKQHLAQIVMYICTVVKFAFFEDAAAAVLSVEADVSPNLVCMSDIVQALAFRTLRLASSAHSQCLLTG